MISLSLLLVGPLLAAPATQDTPEPSAPPGAPARDAVPAGVTDDARPRADQLKSRIHDLRMSLLLGGERVQRAEREAIDFYGRKSQEVDRHLDTIQADLAESRTAYDVALERALGAPTPEARQAAMQEAAKLRGGISALEGDRDDFVKRRKNLSVLIDAVDERGRERDKLAARIESAAGIDEMTLPFLGMGLLPEGGEPAPASVGDELIADLLERDPLQARRVLFEMDPQAYWTRFPLQPPTGALLEALPFPSPDLPANR